MRSVASLAGLQWWRVDRPEVEPDSPGAPQVSSVEYDNAFVAWPVSAWALTYRLERSTNQTTWTAVYEGMDRWSTQTGLTQLTTYYYRVTAINGVGESAPSPLLSFTTPALPTAPPAVPAAPTYGDPLTTSVQVSWAAVPDASAYAVQRSTDQATWTQRYSDADTTFTDIGMTANTRYYHRVSASNRAGSSAFSPAATVLTDPPLSTPATPAIPTASGTSSGSTTLTWPAVSGATQYRVRRSTNQTTWTNDVYVGSSPTALLTGLAASTSYYFQVLAENASGASAYSGSRLVTTGAAVVGTYTPISSQAVQENYGVQTFPTFGTRTYSDVDAYMAYVRDMGVGFVRGGYGSGNLAGVRRQVELCTQYGVKWLMSVASEGGCVPTSTTLGEARANVSSIRDTPAVAAICYGIEGLNEPNHNRGTATASNPCLVPSNWAETTVNFQQVISEEMRTTGSPIRNALRVGGSLHDTAADQSYTASGGPANSGDNHFDQLVANGILEFIDVMGQHSYPSGDEPLTKLAERVARIRGAMGANMPILLSEWGYQNMVGHVNYISPDAMQYYDARAIFEIGAPVSAGGQGFKFSRFELLNDPDPGPGYTDVQYWYGMIKTPQMAASSWQPQPSVARVQVILQALRDPGPPYVPERITLTVDKQGFNDVQIYVTQKRNGASTLWAFRKTAIWNKSTDVMTLASPVTITVSDSVGPRSLSVGSAVTSLALR